MVFVFQEVQCWDDFGGLAEASFVTHGAVLEIRFVLVLGFQSVKRISMEICRKNPALRNR